ncbi:MAG: MarR family transcriptional regulator [Clostridiales bacterium]|nr:MarR family transcriptional regulator [Clostridiales bacterium]
MDVFEPESLHMLLVHTMRLYFAHTYRLMDAVGIHPGQVPLLASLHKQNGLSQRELVERMMVKPPTVAVMIRRMERSDLVERRPDEHDQRVSRIFITEKGEEVFSQVGGLVHELDDLMFEGISAEEQLLLRRLFLQIKQNLNDTGEEPDRRRRPRRGSERGVPHAEDL